MSPSKITPEERAGNAQGTKKKAANDRKKKRNLIIKCCGKNKSCLNFQKSNNGTRVIEEKINKKVSTER
jgi:replicative superfamily II helicase